MKIKKFFFYIFIFLLVDLIFTNLLIKDSTYWNSTETKYFQKKDWRIASNIYHHDIKKNINVAENWGPYKYKLITNSLGFRDSKIRKISLIDNTKKRIYINGDSFVEGVGYNYSDTVIGLLEGNFANGYNILNSAVTSYSPSIYYRKTLHYINNGLKFDYCLIFLDISDIPDENFIDEDEKGNIYDIRQKKNKKAFKEKIYYVSRFYRDNFISGRLIGIFREIVGNFKSNLKKRFLASKKFNQSFFTISKDKINLYKSTHIDRSMWTFDSKYSEKWEKNGLKKSSLYLKKLFELLENNNVKSYLVIYPNPGQILFNNNVHERYWVDWTLNNNVNLINLYKYFDESDKETLIKKYFIPGDVHWNRAGHMLVFNALKKELSNIF